MKKEKPTIAVLMSTYNGEKFIKQQLNSIFCQTEVVIKLYVRDDGSTDDTLHIIDEYAEKYPIIKFIDNENLGPGNSFMRLLYLVAFEQDIDFFAFADQDDIWLENKLKVAIDCIQNINSTGPILYSSNQYLFINGENRGFRYKERQSTSLISHLTKNTISGCTFVFNKELAQLVAKAKHANESIIKYRLHDAWLMLVAIACGDVIYDDEAYILYRIHGGNTVGLKGISFKQHLGRLQRFWKQCEDANLRKKTAQQLLESFPGIKEPNKSILQLYANYQSSWGDKWALLSNRDVLQECEENPLVFGLKVLGGVV